jgi:CRP/FNR family transcriptional regulator, cyclic AMP receptor protein
MTTPQHVQINQGLKQRDDDDLRSLLSQICASNTRNRTRFHDRGIVLFAEGDPVRGVYVLKTGSAAVSVSSSEGRVVILRLAHAGEVLGLNCVLSNSFYGTTVKTLAPCYIDFMSRAELIEFSEKSQAGANALLRLLSRELTQLTERTRSLLLPQTASARLANLLLECSRESTRIKKVFTQEDIAQMIGSSRETVTRLLTALRRRNIIQITPDSVLICDRRALENMLESKDQIEPVLRDRPGKV